MSDIILPQEVWDHELTSAPPTPTDWIWHGIIARSNMTLLTSHGKTGKTTLLSMLLSRRTEGGTLAGLAVKPGRTLVVSEEPPEVWEERARRFDFGGKVCFILRPFLAIPTPDEWQALIDRILTLREQHDIDLAVLDPLGPLLRGENQARAIYDALLPLGTLTRAGMAVTMAHHPGKGARPIGLAARGSSALLAHVDVSVEMRQPAGDALTRRRRLVALSRYAETPRRLLMELNAEATDYLMIADDEADEFSANWDHLHGVLEEARQKLTRDDILAEWPPDFDRPGITALRRWLERAVQVGMVACEGRGRRSDPFRYWLPEREAVWKQDPLYELLHGQRQELELPFEPLHPPKRKGKRSQLLDLAFGADDIADVPEEEDE
jgi:hypothetical protein